MNKTNGHETAVRDPFTTEVIDGNPYLQKPPAEPKDDQAKFDQIIEDEDGAPVELEDARKKVHQRRRRIASAGMAGLLLISLVFAVALYRRTPTRIDYGRTKVPSEATATAPNTSNNSRDSRTEKAIDEARRLTDRQASTDSDDASKSNSMARGSDSRTNSETPFKFPESSESTVNAEQGFGALPPSSNAKPIGGETRSESTNTVSVDHPNGVRSQRSSETSLYMNEPVVTRVSNPSGNEGLPPKNSPAVVEDKKQITLPPFASTLPVRTLGALYTLRTGALVRFELTREAKGDGWSLKRGTILVGSTKGGDLDRAYVSLIGFIDPQSGKLVKLGGDLLGSDGGVGLKGKRRQVDGGWSKVLGRIAGAAVDVTGALMSGRSNDTVVISDGLRTKTINPVTDEISGTLGTELDRRQGRSFVEVLAGTPGYVLITDLPSTLDGREPIPDVNSDSLAGKTDVDAKRPATGLSERELADLLSNGSPEQIREALPRMSPQMRKIAEAVLRP